MHRSELVFDLVLLVVGAFIVVASLRMGVGDLRTPGPGAFPLLAGVVLLLAALSVLAFRDRGARSGTSFAREGFRRVAAAVAVLILWVAVVPILGYVVATFFGVLAITKIMKLPGWLKPLCLSAATAGAAYLVFGRWLNIDLPLGILG